MSTRFIYDPESGFVKDQLTNEWLTNAEDCYAVLWSQERKLEAINQFCSDVRETSDLMRSVNLPFRFGFRYIRSHDGKWECPDQGKNMQRFWFGIYTTRTDVGFVFGIIIGARLLAFVRAAKAGKEPGR